MKKKILLPLALLVVFGISRWPGLMPQNFSAVYALVFCAGLYLPGAMGWWVPLVIMGATDIALDCVFYSVNPFSWWQLAPELAYVAMIGLGKWMGGKRPWWLLVGGGLLGAIIFYLITNTASWLSLPGYEKTLAGLVQALTRGLPGYPPTWEFFRNTLLSGGIFTGLFVGAMKANEAMEENEEAEEAEEGEGEKAPEGDKAEA